jgi:thiamine pyrophosphokinase
MPAEGLVSMAAQGASDMVVVITGGDPVERAHLPDLPPGTRVVAADSGVEQAQALGLAIDLAVGDFDSVAPGALDVAAAAGATVERHPEAKDATDLELALDAARAFGSARIHVLGGHGGRFDHLLANALVLARPAYADVTITAQMGPRASQSYARSRRCADRWATSSRCSRSTGRHAVSPRPDCSTH